MTDTIALLDLAVRVARAAGEVLRHRMGSHNSVESKTTATDPVSQADRASEVLITDLLRSARPDDGLLGEEGADRRGTSGLRWVVDPLDGTVNYLYGFPAWAVSVACEDDSGGLVGAVHDPLRGETFSARRGHGSHLRRADNEPHLLGVTDPVPLERALVATGFAYAPERRAEQGRVVAALLPRVRDVRRAGSAALDLSWLAAGRVDGYYEVGTARWDWAAGALIAAEAGAVVRHYAEDGVVAAGPALIGDLQLAVAIS